MKKSAVCPCSQECSFSLHDKDPAKRSRTPEGLSGDCPCQESVDRTQSLRVLLLALASGSTLERRVTFRGGDPAAPHFLPPERCLPCFIQGSSPKRHCTPLTLSPKHNHPMYANALLLPQVVTPILDVLSFSQVSPQTKLSLFPCSNKGVCSSRFDCFSLKYQ